MKRILCFLGLSLLVFTVFSQAWIRPKGGGYSQLGYSYISSSKVYGVGKVSKQLRRQVTDQTLQGYIEYGMGSNLMLTASVPFKFSKTGNEIFATDYLPDTLASGNLNAFGNLSIAGIYGITQGTKWVTSIGIAIDTKTATFDSVVGLRSGVDAWSGLLNINLGTGWGKNFFQANAGYKVRSNNYSAQFIAATQMGRTMKKVQLIFGVEWYASLENGSFDDGTSIHTGLYQNNLEFLAISLKANYAVNKNIKVWGYIGGGLYGQYVASAPSYALTISYEWGEE